MAAKDPMPIRVRFKKGIRTDGAIEAVCITQASQELRLTVEQAKSLAVQINLRFPPA